MVYMGTFLAHSLWFDKGDFEQKINSVIAKDPLAVWNCIDIFGTMVTTMHTHFIYLPLTPNGRSFFFLYSRLKTVCVAYP